VLVRMTPSTIRVPLNGSAECERLIMRGVDRGGDQSRHMDLHVGPHGGCQLSWFVTMIYSRGGHEIERTMVT
jgi:hypothetical protein